MRNGSTPDKAPRTILEMVRWTSGYFESHGVDSPRIDAEILLAHTLGMRRIDLYLNYDKPLCEDERRRFKTAIKRRVNGEPVAYITGSREFWSLELAVNPSVLIPRPETECLVEAVLPFLDENVGTAQRVLDMGTGSGAIVIALAHEHPEHRYIAMDLSAAALQTARHNARRHHVDHCIDWFCGSWDAALSAERALFDLVVANPPYVRSGDMDGLQPEIRRHEPPMALDGSEDGLRCLRRIIESAHLHLKPHGRLALEIGFDQAADVRSIAAGTGRYEPARVVKDYSGLDRVVLMEKSPCGR
jgi:release factor glutamine methyltransferase